METYNEIIEKLEAELEDAMEKQDTIASCKKLKNLVDTYIEISSSATDSLDFQSAALMYKNAGIYNTQIIELCNETLTDKNSKITTEEREDLEDLKGISLGGSIEYAAWENYYNGMYSMIARNPGAAVEFFKNAKIDFNDLFEAVDLISYAIFSKHSNAMELYAEGLEDFIRINFNTAKSKFQRAKILMQDIIDKELEKIKDDPDNKGEYEGIFAAFKTDFQTMKSYYHLSDAHLQFNNRNFKEAAKQFSIVSVETETSMKDFSKGLVASVKTLQEGEYHKWLSYKYLAEGEVFRENDQWDNAINKYTSAKEELEKASDLYVKSGVPGATALQETALNQSQNIHVYESICDRERELKEKIKSLEKELGYLQNRLFDAIKSTGVTVNNTNEVISTVEQNAQIVQNIENNARETIKELLEKLPETNLDPVAKKQIEEKGKELVNSGEKGSKFLGKVKNFTKDVAEVIKNVGEIAKPIAPFVKFLTALL